MREFIYAKEKVNYLKERQLEFKDISEKDARFLLVNEAYFYRVVSYKHYFSKYSVDLSGEDNFGHLDFNDLHELYSLDKLFRDHLSEMCLDIESYLKGHILLMIETSDVIESNEFVYYDILDIEKRYHIEDKMKKRISDFGDVYSKKMLKKYKNMKPVWVLHEYLSFGETIEIMNQFVKKYDYDDFKDNVAFLNAAKITRNITVHGNKMFVSRGNTFSDFKKLQKAYYETFGINVKNEVFSNHFKYNVLASIYVLKVFAPDYIFSQRINDLYINLHSFIKKNKIFTKYKNESVVNDIIQLYNILDKLY